MENDFTFENEAYSLLLHWIENIDWADLKEVRVLYYYIDFHFKLLVIEELMYKQKVLPPIFYLDKFVKEYTKKEIQTYTCEVIPEVKKFFKNLDISTDLLEKATILYQDSGLEGGSEFIQQMFPDWDPGAGDEVFKVANKVIYDLNLLPSLTSIRKFLRNSKNIVLSQCFGRKTVITQKTSLLQMLFLFVPKV